MGLTHNSLYMAIVLMGKVGQNLTKTLTTLLGRMKTGYNGVLGMRGVVGVRCWMTNLSVISTSGTHISYWKSYHAGLVLYTLDIDSCTYQRTKSICSW